MPPPMPQWILDLQVKHDNYLNVFRDGCSGDPYYKAKLSEREDVLPPIGPCGKLLRSSPRMFLDTVVKLYEGRVRRGTNCELWQHVAALDLFLSSMEREVGGTHTATAQRLVDAGLYDVMTKLLSDGDLLDEHPRYLRAILNTLRDIADFATSVVRRTKDYNKGSDVGAQRVSVDSRVARLLSDMFKAVWTHRTVFDNGHTNENYVRHSAQDVRLVIWEICVNTQWSIVLNSPDFDRSGIESMKRTLLYLWMVHSDIGRSVNSDALFLILSETFFITIPAQLVLSRMTEFLEHNLCGPYDPMAVLDRLSETISRTQTTEEVIAGMLTRILWVVRSVLVLPHFHAYLAASHIFQILGHSINVHAASHNDHEVSWRERRDTLDVVRIVTEEASFSQGAETFIRQGVIQMLARGFIDAVNCDFNDSSRGDWSVCTDVLHQYTKIGGALQLRSEKAASDKKQLLPKVFKRAVHAEWYPTLQALRTSPSSPQRSDLLEAWQAFGEALGLIEVDEKEAFEKEKKQLCAWRACEYHTRKAPSATRQCAGCGQVKYCSRTCQQKDWKEGKHKDACKRLKDMPHVPRAP